MKNNFNIEFFYDELEDIATYNSQEWNETEFAKSIRELKKLFEEAKIDLPEEFKLTKHTYDFRSEMQKHGGYKERRERLKQIIYPLIDYTENKKVDITKKTISQSELNNYLKSSNFTLKTNYGEIKNISLQSKSGGNGIVYFGNLNKTEVAIKFLINTDSKKKKRFLCEFINVIMKIDNYDGIVKQYFYQEIPISNCLIPIIVMKKYNNNLEYIDNVDQDYLISCLAQIMKSLKTLHNCGIIHRDLKPQNILLDEDEKLNISDFGIAYYNSELFEMTGDTTKSERLANFDFSAPEQRNSEFEPTKATDIYALGQIMQWLVFGKTHKGTHRKKITEKYNGERMELLDTIIDKCLCDNQIDRYQSIEEIEEQIKNIKGNVRKNNTVLNKSSQMTINEIKEQLKDLIYNITTYEYEGEYGQSCTDKTFSCIEQFNDIKVISFLEEIPYKAKGLLFYEDVYFSDFCDGLFDNQIKIKKEHFLKLNELYLKIKNNNQIYQSFINYIVKSFNECFDLPF